MSLIIALLVTVTLITGLPLLPKKSGIVLMLVSVSAALIGLHFLYDNANLSRIQSSHQEELARRQRTYEALQHAIAGTVNLPQDHKSWLEKDGTLVITSTLSGNRWNSLPPNSTTLLSRLTNQDRSKKLWRTDETNSFSNGPFVSCWQF